MCQLYRIKTDSCKQAICCLYRSINLCKTGFLPLQSSTFDGSSRWNGKESVFWSVPWLERCMSKWELTCKTQRSLPGNRESIYYGVSSFSRRDWRSPNNVLIGFIIGIDRKLIIKLARICTFIKNELKNLVIKQRLTVGSVRDDVAPPIYLPPQFAEQTVNWKRWTKQRKAMTGGFLTILNFTSTWAPDPTVQTENNFFSVRFKEP